MAERIIYSLDTNGYLKTPLEELLPPLAAEVNGDCSALSRRSSWRIAEQALARGAAARSAGRRRPHAQRVPAAAAHSGHAVLRGAAGR